MRAPDHFDRQIGARVRARRVALGLSQERLAALLGITFQQVQKYEKGANRVSASRLFSIAKALDIGVEFFFSEAVAPGGGKLKAPTKMPPDAVELAELFVSIEDETVRRRVLQIVRGVSAGGG